MFKLWTFALLSAACLGANVKSHITSQTSIQTSVETEQAVASASSVNVLLNVPTSSSPTHNNGQAYWAVQGSKDKCYYQSSYPLQGPSIFKTPAQINPWWLADLASAKTIV